MTLIIWVCVIFPIGFTVIVKHLLKKYKNIDLPFGFWRSNELTYSEVILGLVMLVGIVISFIIYIIATGDYSMLR